MKKLLFLTPELPYPLQSGGKFKTWKMLEGLCNEFEVTVVCPLKMDDEKYVDEFILSLNLSGLVTDPVDVPRSMKTLLQSYVLGVPLNIHRTASKKIRSWVSKYAQDFDLIFMDSYEVGQFLPKETSLPAGLPVVYHAHNVYHQLWERYSKISKNPAHKLVCALEAVRVRRYELDVCKKAAMVYASDNDRQLLSECGVGSDKMKYTCHLGDDSQLSLPSLKFDKDKRQLCFVGYLGWEPNSQGLSWFIDEVWPSIKSENPDVVLKVAGRGAPDSLVKKASQDQNIELLGFVEDLETLYAESSVCVAPVLFGSGIKVKVLHAMARGIPVVTTDVGAEGIRTSNLDGLVITNQPGEMANAVKSLLEHKDLWKHFAQRSRDIVKERYTWNSLRVSMMKDLYETFPRLANFGFPDQSVTTVSARNTFANELQPRYGYAANASSYA